MQPLPWLVAWSQPILLYNNTRNITQQRALSWLEACCEPVSSCTTCLLYAPASIRSPSPFMNSSVHPRQAYLAPTSVFFSPFSRLSPFHACLCCQGVYYDPSTNLRVAVLSTSNSNAKVLVCLSASPCPGEKGLTGRKYDCECNCHLTSCPNAFALCPRRVLVAIREDAVICLEGSSWLQPAV